jgi:hypothetical protein
VIPCVKIWAILVYLALILVDMVIFRLKGRLGLDVTLLRYAGMVFTYSGNQENK